HGAQVLHPTRLIERGRQDATRCAAAERKHFGFRCLERVEDFLLEPAKSERHFGYASKRRKYLALGSVRSLFFCTEDALSCLALAFHLLVKDPAGANSKQ